MKRSVYISCFVVLGLLLQFVVHGLLEISVIAFLLSKTMLGLPWTTWVYIHHIGAVILLVGGVVFGYQAGIHGWGIVYEKNTL